MRFQELLAKNNIDLFITLNGDSHPENTTMQYLVGYGSLGVLGIPQKGKPLLFVPEMEFERAKKSPAKVSLWKGSALEALKKQCKTASRIGIEEDKLPFRYVNAIKKVFKGAKIVPADELLSDAKIIKSSAEQELYEEASRITAKVLNKMIDHASSFKKESDVAAFLTYETARQGYTLSFPIIVASGKHASQPHYDTAPVKIEKGFCIVDFGILYKGYCTDVSRTLFFGNPSKKEKQVYEHVLNVQQECIELSVPHAKCADVFAHAAKKLGKPFCHSLGHGIGTEVHESPNLSPRSTQVLQEGMVFTIEPGVYYPGKFGIRIEDDIVLKKKPKALSKTTKELVSI